MNIVIVGQKWFACALIDQCVDSGHDVLNVFAPAGDRAHDAARRHDIPSIVSKNRLNPADVPAGTDVILAAHAHTFITAGARDGSRLGALGYHPSLLPRHRGRDAVRWAIHMREPVTGGTLYWLDDGADTGSIALQNWCHVRPDDTARTLWRRELAPMGLRLFSVAMEMAARNEEIPCIKQDESIATFEPSFTNKLFSDT